MSSTNRASFGALLTLLPLAAAAQIATDGPRIDVNLIMPPLVAAPDHQIEMVAGPGASDVKLRAMLDEASKLRLESLMSSRPVANQAALDEMRQYLFNAYAGLTVKKTIQIGSLTFLCIPISEQPALRSGSISLESPPAPGDSPSPDGILGKDVENCPAGTIPFEDSDADRLTSFQTLGDFLSKDRGLSRRLGQGRYELERRPKPGEGAQLSDGYTHRYASASQNATATGMGANLNIWSPIVPYGQMSLSQIWVIGDRDGGSQTLEVGWQVSRWKDEDHAVPFVYWTSDDYQTTGCYELQCVGFVQVTNRIVFARLKDSLYSSPKGVQSELRLEIRQHPSSGNWWLRINDIWVGYWPKQLFIGGSLAQNSPPLRLDAGGENTGETPNAQMGSGRYASDGFALSAYQSNVRYLDAGGKSVPFHGTPYVTNESCYSFSEKGSTPPTAKSGSFFYFGGPGSADGRCK